MFRRAQHRNVLALLSAFDSQKLARCRDFRDNRDNKDKQARGAASRRP